MVRATNRVGAVENNEALVKAACWADPAPSNTVGTADTGDTALRNEPGVDGANRAAGTPPNPTALFRQ